MTPHSAGATESLGLPNQASPACSRWSRAKLYCTVSRCRDCVTRTRGTTPAHFCFLDVLAGSPNLHLILQCTHQLYTILAKGVVATVFAKTSHGLREAHRSHRVLPTYLGRLDMVAS